METYGKIYFSRPLSCMYTILIRMLKFCALFFSKFKISTNCKHLSRAFSCVRVYFIFCHAEYYPLKVYNIERYWNVFYLYIVHSNKCIINYTLFSNTVINCSFQIKTLKQKSPKKEKVPRQHTMLCLTRHHTEKRMCQMCIIEYLIGILILISGITT